MKMNKLKVCSVIFAIIFLTVTFHHASGEYTVLRRVLSRCIRRYGHSCLGGHGKRSQIPPINSYDMIMPRPLAPSRPAQETNILEQLSPPPLPPYGMGVILSREEDGDDNSQRLPTPVVDLDRLHDIIFQKLMRTNDPYNERFIEDDETMNKK